eukprot:scaffold12694_cov32-Tisochrysis_lutea.AAC.3
MSSPPSKRPSSPFGRRIRDFGTSARGSFSCTARARAITFTDCVFKSSKEWRNSLVAISDASMSSAVVSACGPPTIRSGGGLLGRIDS